MREEDGEEGGRLVKSGMVQRMTVVDVVEWVVWNLEGNSPACQRLS